jgi:hypothetical protein
MGPILIALIFFLSEIEDWLKMDAHSIEKQVALAVRGEKIIRAWDRDFKPDTILKLFGISIPVTDETFFYLTESFITVDSIVDSIEHLWPIINEKI